VSASEPVVPGPSPVLLVDVDVDVVEGDADVAASSAVPVFVGISAIVGPPLVLVPGSGS